jgi:uncharacterized membrane protein
MAKLKAPFRVSISCRAAKGRNVKHLTMAIGLAIATIGLVVVAAPSLLLEFGQSLLTPTALYIVAAVRIGIGLVLVRVAPDSRTPKVLRIVGILIIIAGLLTPFFGVERSRAIFDWLSGQDPLFVRLGAGVAVAFGLFIIYAVTSPRRTDA